MSAHSSKNKPGEKKVLALWHCSTTATADCRAVKEVTKRVSPVMYVYAYDIYQAPGTRGVTLLPITRVLASITRLANTRLG